MATVYVYDKNGEYTGNYREVTPENYQLADNESYDKPQKVYEYGDDYTLTGIARIKPGNPWPNSTPLTPPDGLNEPTYDPVEQRWHGISNEAYRAKYNVPESKPSDTTEIVNALAQQVVSLQAEVKELKGSENND